MKNGLTYLKGNLQIIAVVAFCILCATITLEALRQGEHTVKGKSLSFWLDQYRSSLSYGGDEWVGKRTEAESAIRQLGPNAVPQLVTMLHKQDTVLEKVVELLQKQNLITIHYKPASVRNFEAALGFQILGPDASQAVPVLIGIIKEPPSTASQISSCDALGGIGTAASAAIPALVVLVTNSPLSVRIAAIAALGCIHSSPRTVVPVLINCLKDPAVVIRSRAAVSLSQFGPDARDAIPDLVQLLGANEKVIRSSAEMALKQVDPGRKTNQDALH